MAWRYIIKKLTVTVNFHFYYYKLYGKINFIY